MVVIIKQIKVYAMRFIAGYLSERNTISVFVSNMYVEATIARGRDRKMLLWYKLHLLREIYLSEKYAICILYK